MHEDKSGYVELSRIIMARSMKVPPDDIDMHAIFKCVQRAIEEKVENNVSEYTLTPSNRREFKAVVSEVGETIIPMIFDHEYPFGNFAEDYEQWYENSLLDQFFKMRMQSEKDS